MPPVAGRRKAGTAAAAADAATQKPLHERVDDVQRRRQEKLLAAREVGVHARQPLAPACAHQQCYIEGRARV
jgi:hypothetical protein